MRGELSPAEGAELDQAEATIRDAIAPLDSIGARNLTQRIKLDVAHAWLGLLEADTRKAWAALGYANFADYVMHEFDISQTHAYRLIDHARVIEALAESDSPIGEIKESQARVLKPVLDEYGPAAASKVMEEAKASGKVTASTLAHTAENLGYAKITDTTRTSETTTVEYVDTETGEITSSGSDTPPPADSVTAPGVEQLTEPEAQDPIADVIAQAHEANRRDPGLLAQKAVERFDLALKTIDTAGGLDAIERALANNTIQDDSLWLSTLETTVQAAGIWASNIRRRNLRIVK